MMHCGFTTVEKLKLCDMCKNRYYLLMYTVYLAILAWTGFCEGAKDMTWCTVSHEEQNKCIVLSAAVREKMSEFGEEYYTVKCVQGANKENCMKLIDQEQADITSVDPGLVYIASRYHSLVPIVQEVYGDRQTHHFSIVVIKRDSMPEVRKLNDLRGKKACFAAVGTLAGWFIPINTIMKHGGMEIYDCNNHIKTAINYFGDSCAVNSLIDKYNPIGDNSNKLCKICGGVGVGQKCTINDPYYGYHGAILCLMNAGDIAFVTHSSLEYLDNPENFQLLCKDGTRQSIGEYMKCNWGRVPTDSLVTTTAKNTEEKQSYQRFFKKLMEVLGDGRLENNPANRVFDDVTKKKSGFQIFQNFSGRNLLLQDSTNDLRPVDGSRQLFSTFLQENINHISGVHNCPFASMSMCVSSDIEHEKCMKMKTALNAQMLKPQLNCFRTESQIKCMEAIKNRLADVAVFDASDVFDAGKFYDLVPFMSEIYDLGEPEYYVIAAVKEEDPSTELTYLKNKYTCHGGINTAAGWTVPLAVLISNSWIRNYECDPIRTTSEYFTKSCVPGSLSYEYTKERAQVNLCELCHGSTYRFCKRNPTEDYFGSTGAFRCLVEGGGEVAFTRHTTIFENTDGKNKDIWARNTFSSDFELLCIDGKRSEVKNFRNCSLGKVKANAIVARGGHEINETEINAYINLFSYAQQYYGRKNDDYLSFGLFSSPSPYSNIIFQDATTRLQAIPTEKRNYEAYLGRDFVRAKKIVDCR